MAGNDHAARKHLYGITRLDYQALLVRQQGKCAACGEGETRTKANGDTRSLSVDHCHDSGKIRGLLCDRCNSTLGRVKDSPALLRRLASYLEVSETGFNIPRINADEAIAELSNINGGA